jgi:hypothetical protein
MLVGVSAPAFAQTSSGWDSRGWVMLGETTVNGHRKVDHDTIAVGKQEGRFDKLTLVVEDSDLEMVDFTVNFGKGEAWHPPVSHYFREGQRTRLLEFPESAWGNTSRSIKTISFAYRNLPGGGRARVQVWGFRTSQATTAAPPPPPAPVWDSRGWVALGEREVNGHGKMDQDRIDVGRLEGKFSKLTLVVENNDLELMGLAVTFDHGKAYQAPVNHYFREGQRSRAIDLPDNVWGDGRFIKTIELAYRNLPGGGHAHVRIFGWRVDSAPAAPPPPPAPTAWRFDSTGWVMLGEREVHGHGRTNSDRLEVGRSEGKFSRLTLVVMDADLELTDMSVQFRHGDPWHPATKHYFKEGSRARVIELPASEHGGDARTIQYIDLSYRNLPGEGHARVQVWGQ